jgi:uncharacterized membrane protein YedE/YeeE
MAIDWNSFTPVSALVGGLAIGVAAVLFAILAGRVAGISGIVGGLLRPARGDIAWRVAFVAGLIVAPFAFSLATQASLPRIDAPTGLLVAGGLLVGWGTRVGSGCTSGHGVCGLARRSPRSLVATLAFMAVGIATVFVMRHLLS